MVLPKADSVLRKFILDLDARKKILDAWLKDDVTLESDEEQKEEETTIVPIVEEEPEEPALDIEKVKARIDEILTNTLTGVSKYMRRQDEVIDSVFYVLDKKSLEKLDGVGLFIMRAFTNLFVKKATIVDKFVSFNLLVTKFEAYLKNSSS